MAFIKGLHGSELRQIMRIKEAAEAESLLQLLLQAAKM